MENQEKKNGMKNVSTALSINPEHMLTKFSTLYEDGKILIRWSIISYSDDNTYWVERSSDGREYEIIGMKEGRISGDGMELMFSFTDFNPSQEYSWYRIRFGKKLSLRHVNLLEMEENCPLTAGGEPVLVFN